MGSSEPPLNSDKRGDDRRTDYDANWPKGRIPTFCAVIFYAHHDGFSDWRAIAPGPKTAISPPPQLPCTVFATVLMVSTRRLFQNDCVRGLKWFLGLDLRRSCIKRPQGIG